jgi:hypothetical protein
MTSYELRALLVTTLALLAGCSDIPKGGDPAADPRIKAQAAMGAPRLGAVAVAPIDTFTLAPDEAAKGWKLGEVPSLDPDGVRNSVARALTTSGKWENVRLGEKDTLADAWQHHEDFVASVAIENLRTGFEGHNGWWVPNIINFVCFVVPAWWVATEEYSLSFDAHVTLTSAESGARVVGTDIPVKVTGTFDDFDRGWQFFGPIHSSLDAEEWRGIATTLFPAAQRELAVRVAGELEHAVRPVSKGEEIREARRKTLVLAVGVGHYQDPAAFPPVSFATKDALRVADTFLAAGALRQHVVTLLDGAATVAAVRSSVVNHLGRARDGDGVVFYFAGYGTRRPDGAAALLLGDAASGKKTGTLELAELASLMGKLRGKKVVILDAGFAGLGRSVLAGEPPPAPASDLVPFDKAGLAAIVAAGPAETVLAPEHLSSGLLTYHLVQALARAHEAKGPASLQELFTAVYAAVAADAELLGATQLPRAVGLENGFPLWLPTGARTERP